MTSQDIVNIVVGALVLIAAVGGAIAIKAFATMLRLTKREPEQPEPESPEPGSADPTTEKEDIQ